MNELNGVRADVISRSRGLDDVLKAYMKAYAAAKKVAEGSTSDEAEITAEAMLGATYRVYLLGVEDGMNGGTT